MCDSVSLPFSVIVVIFLHLVTTLWIPFENIIDDTRTSRMLRLLSISTNTLSLYSVRNVQICLMSPQGIFNLDTIIIKRHLL